MKASNHHRREARGHWGAFLAGLALIVSGACTVNPADMKSAGKSLLPTSEMERPDLARHFEALDAEGAFTAYDQTRNIRYRYRPEWCAEQFAPASTFKIFNALVALETGVVADENEMFQWDGIDRGSRDWNRDHSLRTAFAASAVWVFQEVARRVGREQMEHFLERERYGNQVIGPSVDSFWLDGSLRISPDEQVEFLRRLSRDELGFSRRVMESVREMMGINGEKTWWLYGKTGWTRDVDGIAHQGWIVGWVERGGPPMFFACYVRSNDPQFDMRSARWTITHGCMTDLGVPFPARPSAKAFAVDRRSVTAH